MVNTNLVHEWLCIGLGNIETEKKRAYEMHVGVTN